MEALYRTIKGDFAASFFKLLIAVCAFLCLFALVVSILAKDTTAIASASGILALCGGVWRFSDKFKKYLGSMLTIMSLGLIIGGLFQMRSFVKIFQQDCLRAFYIGYAFGMIERIMILELPRLEMKLFLGAISIVARFLVFPITSIITILYHAFLFIIGAVVDIWREKDDRALFKSFYDYREELTKFKNIMVSGLPTNILILSRNLEQSLFSNKHFESSFQISKACEAEWDQIKWLKNFKLERDTLNSHSRDILGANPDTLPTLYSVLQRILSRIPFDADLSQFCLNVNTHVGDGETVKKEIFDVKLFFVPWDGKEAIAVVLNNITQQYLNAALQVADTNKDKMIAMVSHELKTPLNGILGMISLLEKQIEDSQLLTYLTFCRNNGKLLLNIVNSILDLGLIRNNKFKLTVEKGNIFEILHDIYILFEYQFISKSIYLRINATPAINDAPFIITDINRLKQILINLIGNALKFTFSGGVEVLTDIDPSREGCLLFTVSDTGIGIKEKDKEKLFKMYGRLDQPNAESNSQGVGLGLTISNHLVKLLAGDEQSGDIKIQSEFEKGTTFSFSVKADLSQSESFEGDIRDTEGREHNNSILSSRNEQSKGSHFLAGGNSFVCLSPFTPGARGLLSYQLNSAASSSFKVLEQNTTHRKAGNSQKVHSMSPSEISFQSENEEEIECEEIPERGVVLIVDDSPFNIMVAQHMIEGLGFIVKSALNGQLAVDMVKEYYTVEKKKFKIIFMDLQMPVMDGYEATKALRQMMKMREVPETPIVALSANDNEQDKMQCREVGMSDHLGKPLNEQQLRKVLNRFCRPG